MHIPGAVLWRVVAADQRAMVVQGLLGSHDRCLSTAGSGRVRGKLSAVLIVTANSEILLTALYCDSRTEALTALYF